MAFPTGWSGYDELLLPNPASAMTDFVYRISLGLLSETWWANVKADGGDIRATLRDGTQLPCHLISFTDGSPGSGVLDVKFAGVKAATGADTIRVWCGKADESLPAAGDTYGQHATYEAGIRGDWPAGLGNDQTSYANHMTAVGSPTVGGAAGKLAGTTGTTLNGTTQYGTSSVSVNTAHPWCFVGWAKTAVGADQYMMAAGDTAGAAQNLVGVRNKGSGGRIIDAVIGAAGSFGLSSTGEVSDLATYSQFGARFASTTSRQAVGNGVLAAANTTSLSPSSIDIISIGALVTSTVLQPFSGTLSSCRLYSRDVTADEYAYLYAMYAHQEAGNFYNFGGWNGTGKHFLLGRNAATALIPMPASMAGQKPYYPCITEMSGVPNFPFDYALFFSPDHDNGPGGIWMYLCNGDPSVAANWISYDDAVIAGDFDYIVSKPTENPIYTDDVVGDQTETPHALVVGGEVYLTYHNRDSGLPGQVQATELAISTDGVNYTRQGVILGCDFERFSGDGHTGYFVWCANPFPLLDYEYIGYSLLGGNLTGQQLLWGSDDAETWVQVKRLEHVKNYADIPTGHVIKWSAIDTNSIADCGNGEFVMLVTIGVLAATAAAGSERLYEMYVAGDGYTMTRKPRLVKDRGLSGTIDNAGCLGPTSVTYSGKLVTIYIGSDGGTSHILCCTGYFNATADLPAKLTRPNYDENLVDFRGLVSLPAWLAAEGSGNATSLSASGLTLDGAAGPTYSGVRYASNITPSDHSFIEVMLLGAEGVGTSIPYLQIGDTGPALSDNGVQITADADGTTLLNERVTGSTDETIDANYAWGRGANSLHDIGFRWDVDNEVLYLLGETMQPRESLSVPTVNPATAMRPRVSVSLDDMTVQGMLVRLGNTNGAAAPTIVSTSATTTYIDVTLSAAVVGLAGFTVNVDASPITVVASRQSPTVIRLTRSSGTFGSGAITLDYDESSGDVRSLTLVGVQDVTALSVTSPDSGGGGRGMGSKYGHTLLRP